MHGCNDIPLVRTIFSQDERSRYKRASLYSQNAMVSKQGGILPRMPWFPNRGHSAQNATVSEQGGILPRMPWFPCHLSITLVAH